MLGSAKSLMSSEATIEDTEVAILGRVLEVENGNLSPAVARSWLDLRLAARDEKRLLELAAKSKKEELTPDEAVLLENYLHVGRLLDLMRSKARRSLKTA